VGNRTLLAQLEAENATLRARMIDLFLQVQALRDGAKT
jgi:cell division protein FtsB